MYGVKCKCVYGSIRAIFNFFCVKARSNGKRYKEETYNYWSKLYSHLKDCVYLQVAKIGTFFSILNIEGKFYIKL